MEPAPLIELSRLDLAETGELRRVPPRPVEHRQADYEENFDDLTVFYDCFIASDGRRIICIGPPLLNLRSIVLAAVERAFRKSLFSRRDIRRLDRHDQIRMKLRNTHATLDSRFFQQRMLVAQPNQCELFRGKRVLLTKSKDNDLLWIRDWVQFHVVNHGCNGVLLYDNASSRYGPDQIRAAISSIGGLDVVQVVSWPYKFGPQAGPSEIWDSDFSQYAALEHARHRFLGSAAAVLNADIDELVVTRSGTSIFDLVRNSRTGYLKYSGVMIENVSAAPPIGMGRHRDFIYQKRPAQAATQKWCVVPPRCSVRSQWCVHSVTEMVADEHLSSDVEHRHFKAIRTDWRYPRSPPVPPGESHEVDGLLIARMACVEGW